MTLTPLRCTGCGGNIDDYDPESRLVRCKRLGCGRSFLIEDGRAFAGVDDKKAAEIGERRRALAAFMRAGDYQGAETAARDILQIMPDGHDFLAQFHYHYARKLSGGDPRPYERFISVKHEAAPQDIQAAIQCAFERMEIREEEAVERFIRLNCEDPSERNEYISRLVMNVRELESKQDDYAQVPRDVFICHRAATEGALAKALAERMESEGWTAWYAERNIRPHATDYWRLIEYAIKNCKVFLVLASKSAMTSQDVQKEIRVAAEADIRRVEWKLDDTPHNLAFRYFFDGIQWVNGQTRSEAETEHLIYRIYEELNPAPIIARKPAPAPEPANQPTPPVPAPVRIIAPEPKPRTESKIEIDEETEIPVKASPPSFFEHIINDDGNITITEYVGDNAQEVVIPQKIGKRAVTAIGDSAFQDCSELTKIVIQNGVSSIGDYAFSGCGDLTDVVLPNSLIHIGESAFEGCDSLMKICLPHGVARIDDCAFSNCGDLTDIVLPDSLIRIGERAFAGCSSLIKMCIPRGVTRIEDNLFSDCSELTEVILPNSLTYIGESAFEDCGNLTDINIPNSVTNIGACAFLYCNSITEIIIPKSVTSIGDCAFVNCDSITEIFVPNTVTNIGYGVFSWCNRLMDINIEEGVTVIGDKEFSMCVKLTNINIPNSVTMIKKEAFYGCSNLTKINIPNSVTYIGEGAFKDCESLMEIIIPDSVTSIGKDVFKGCKDLVISLYRGSYADKYFTSGVFRKHKYKYKYIG